MSKWLTTEEIISKKEEKRTVSHYRFEIKSNLDLHE